MFSRGRAERRDAMFWRRAWGVRRGLGDGVEGGVGGDAVDDLD